MIKDTYTLEDFDFELPEELIAQYPIQKRDESRLLVLNKDKGSIKHEKFSNLPDLLKPDDLLVFNNAKVINGRIFAKRQTGSKIEFVLVEKLSDSEWLAVCNRTKRLSVGEKLFCNNDDSITIEIIDKIDDHLKIKFNQIITDFLLEKIGNIPLPPYIKRDSESIDASRYQTVYASKSGALAAPTAGLHFTSELIDSLSRKGIGIEYLTLYVSLGTFQPVRHSNLDLHNMHSESYSLDEKTANIINEARKSARRIIAVGTTSLRVLEAAFKEDKNIAQSGSTDIFIKPPYKIKSIDALITNFHTPHSTLLMLVSAFAGYDLILDTYKIAVNNEYRFFSYGDAMLIE